MSNCKLKTGSLIMNAIVSRSENFYFRLCVQINSTDRQLKKPYLVGPKPHVTCLLTVLGKYTVYRAV
jgi:hypothetical protein